MVSLSPYSLSSFTMQAQEDCLAHDHYRPEVFLDSSPEELTVTELLNRIPGAISLQLDFDVLEGWHCRNCGEEFTAARLSQTSAALDRCPNCKAQRSPQLTHEISHAARLAHSSLHALGIPPRSILRVRTESGQCCVEIAGTHFSRSSR